MYASDGVTIMLNTIHIGTIANAAERKSRRKAQQRQHQRRADEADHHQPPAAPAIAQSSVNRMHRGGGNRGDAEQRSDSAPAPARDALASTSGITGSSIAIVPPPAMTTSAQIATGRWVRTRRIGTDAPRAAVSRARRAQTTTRSTTAIAATTRNGRRMPPISYSQPPTPAR